MDINIIFPKLNRTKKVLMTFVLCFSTAISIAQRKDTLKISISATAGLQFDKARFAVHPGDLVALTFKNADDMSHNIVFTRPGERTNVINEAQALAPDVAERQGFVPKSDKVLFAVQAIHPGESRKLTFKAPMTEGVYPYVCTFTGHGYVMYGAMYVTNGTLPAIQNDQNVPPNRRNDGTHDDDEHDMSKMGAALKTVSAAKFTPTSHPYLVEPPTIYRIFMPDASPASIAVNLPGNLSYCWDAGTSRLRYAWSGGFLDNADHWKGNGRFLPKVVGTVFYRSSNDPEFRVGKRTEAPLAQFKGYRLLNKYPQFLYSLGNVEVSETIAGAQWEGKGLVRNFTFKNLKSDLYFFTDVNDGMAYSSSAGQWKNGVLKLTAKEARQFSITMVEKPLTHPNHDQ